MANISKEDVDAVIDLLRDFPANGRPAMTEVREYALHLGLIATHTQQETCTKCGARSDSYSYYKITPAGRALLTFADAALARKAKEMQS